MTGTSSPAATDVLPTGLLIGGEWVTGSSGGTYDHIYPADGRPNATVELAGDAEIDAAVRSAWRAHREWISHTPERRRDLMIALADAMRDDIERLGRLNVHDFAVPIVMSPGHAALAEGFIRYYAGYIDKDTGTSTPVSNKFDVNLIEHEPYGVVGIIAPWNGPLVVIGLNVAAALAAGNAVVLKPSEISPFTPLRFGELCLRVGMPAGLVNVVPSGPEGGAALVRHPGVRKIHFTGGGHTARAIITTAAANLTPVATELGGKSANIVFADADLDAAARLAAFQGPLGQAGQSCACGSRILVEAPVYDEFMAKFLAVVTSAPVGDPFDPANLVGPVVSQAATDRILQVIDRAVADRMGELVTGGNRLGGDLAAGYYLEPTVFADVDNRSPLAQHETFGPVVSVMRFTDEAEAVAIANDTTFGLNAFVQTTDLTKAHRIARQLESGSVWINRNSDISPQSPYGGYKQSGTGRAGGLEGLREFQQVKNIRIGMP
ncbi:aldehyde dehydrogenase family protein [Nocardia aurantia]|uniref:Putative aldehyde dehydrogenase AldA n=1 Tax=Nocardia aurantia TaxID=2585199 RepID=A0A7K0DLA5_9NOCA|nr:aldehyde dehydrogenase family protein [Nocardia aurantia]MQY26546.1 putative aldehyde dehydrogenase AldA [Nocardia aurantia]